MQSGYLTKRQGHGLLHALHLDSIQQSGNAAVFGKLCHISQSDIHSFTKLTYRVSALARQLRLSGPHVGPPAHRDVSSTEFTIFPQEVTS
jgi:hypothetical protein